MGAFNLETCARPNILKLEPYRCARDDYKDDGTNILLDANENAYGPGLHLSADSPLPDGISASSQPRLDLHGLNRYPDPHQTELKQLFCDLRNSGAHSSRPLTPEHMFVGAGSDEAIDAILRSFCVPGRDKLLTCPPTYGMYAVSAAVNDVGVVRVPLDTTTAGDFALRPDAVNAALSADAGIKAVYVCSPGNPTGNLLAKEHVRAILEHPTWNGVVVVDEAYVDFAPDPAVDSLATWVPEWPNLIVMQTMSKAFGLAGIRVGVAFADPAVARLFNNLKAPYNVAQPSSVLATYALGRESLAVAAENRRSIVAQKARLFAELPKIAGVGRVRGGKAANFLLAELVKLDTNEPSNEVALAVYERLAEHRGIVVRFRGKEEGCFGCLRITVGTEREMDRFLADLQVVLNDIARGSESSSIRRKSVSQEQAEEDRANKIIA